MLKIWKQAWRKAGAEAAPPPRHDSEQEAQLCRANNEGTRSPSIDVDPPIVDDASGAVLSAAARKRALSLQSSASETSFPSKRPKTIHDAASAGQPEPTLGGPLRPTEIVVLYEPPSKLTFTPLYKHLREVDKEEKYSRRHFSAALHVLLDMGSCASDLVWRRALPDLDVSIRMAYNEDEQHAKEYVALFETREIVKNWEYTMPNLDSSSRGLNVTPKFLKLVQILQSCRPHEDSFRGIVFVCRRAIALVMAELLRLLDITGLRPQVLIGNEIHTDFSSQNEIFCGFETGTHNLLIATKWAEDLEIPPASVVIRYDLFDSHLSYANCRARTRGKDSHLIHMMQRSCDSHRRKLLQITRLDGTMQTWMDNLQNPESSVPPAAMQDSHDPYLSDSEDEDDTAPRIKDPTTGARIRVQDATGIVLRFSANVSASEGGSRHSSPLFRFETIHKSRNAQTQFVCTVTLPPGPRIPPVSGPPSMSKAHARRLACYQMCNELFDRGLIGPQLFPRSSKTIGQKGIPDVSHTLDTTDENLIATISSQSKAGNKQTGVHGYSRKKPEFWENTLALKSDSLYPTVISAQGQEPYGPLVLLTRAPLPCTSSLRVFDSGFRIAVELKPGARFDVDAERLHDLYRYTIRVFRSIVNKPLICQLEGMPYFLAPLKTSWPGFSRPQVDRWHINEVANTIPWDLVKLAADNWVTGLDMENLEGSLEDAIIQDRWIEYTRRYYALKLRPDLTPLSKPVDSPREAKYGSFLEYCKNRRKGFEGLHDCDQPLIEVDRVLPPLNRLNPATKDPPIPTKHPAKYLIPELCARFTIAASTFRTALLLPSIMRRIDDMLLVTELNATLFDHSIQGHQLLVAISAPSACIEFDYERLELLGDAYLKYLSSIYLFVTNPAQHEGALHSARLRIISNKALFLNAECVGLAPYIQSKPLVPKQWTPPKFKVIPPPPPKTASTESVTAMNTDDTGRDSGAADKVQAQTQGDERKDKEHDPTSPSVCPGSVDVDLDTHPTTVDGVKSSDSAVADSIVVEKGKFDEGAPPDEAPKPAVEQVPAKKSKKDDPNMQWLGEKAVADVVEAIIGAAYISGGSETALKASKALRIAVPSVDQWSDFARKALAPPPDVTTRLRPGTVEAIEEIMGHRFHRPHILAQALTHASIQGFEMTCYQRLEFLGDAILDFLVIRHIYDRDATLSPGALTLLKGAMVSNQALGAICVEVGLHEHLMFESFDLANKIRAYAENLKRKRDAEYELAKQEDRTPGQYWIDTAPPKALSDVVESVIGAIFISDNFSPEGAQSFFDKILKPFYDKHITLRTLSHHPTKTLFEVLQAHGCQQFEVTREHEATEECLYGTLCSVVIHEVTLASATGRTAAYAAKRAAVYALDAIEGDPGFITRTCDCRAKSQAKKAHKKALKQMLASLQEQSEDQEAVAVEQALTLVEGEGDVDGSVVETGDNGDTQI